MEYPNLKELFFSRRIALLVVTLLVALVFLVATWFNYRGAQAPDQPWSQPDSQLSRQQAAAAQQGQSLTPDEIAQWKALDLSLAQRLANFRRVLTIFCALAGGGLLLYALFLAKTDGVVRSTLARRAAAYTGLPRAQVLPLLENDLEEPPIYECPQLTLTDAWVFGQVGASHDPVAIPLAALVGIFLHPQLRRVRGQKTQFYQLLLWDAQDKATVFALQEQKQMEAAYAALARRCPYALTGGYKEYQAHSALPQAQRHDLIRKILAARKES